MVRAEKRLYANALLNRKNARFVLLSESCIPLFDFEYVYNYIMSSNVSFITASHDPRENHTYDPIMLPEVTKEQWKKGDEWKELSRSLAKTTLEDTLFEDKFVKHCLPPCDPFYKGYMDERYIPTLLHIKRQKDIANRCLTWVDWKRHFKWSHPHTYHKDETTLPILLELRNKTVYSPFDSGQEKQECRINGKGPYPCYLFARKFHQDGLKRLMKLSWLVA